MLHSCITDVFMCVPCMWMKQLFQNSIFTIPIICGCSGCCKSLFAQMHRYLLYKCTRSNLDCDTVSQNYLILIIIRSKTCTELNIMPYQQYVLQLMLLMTIYPNVIRFSRRAFGFVWTVVTCYLDLLISIKYLT